MSAISHLFAALLGLLVIESATAARHGFRHEAIDTPNKPLIKRLAPISTNNTTELACPHPVSIYSVIYPSPNASPIQITKQSQVVTSYLPEMTWCKGPPIVPIPQSIPPYANRTSTLLLSTADTCETVYVPTATTVCATTLTGIGTKVPVTRCDQQVTFSSDLGFTLQTPTPVVTNFTVSTPEPTVKRMVTYYLAPWDALLHGDTPSDVDVKTCTIRADESLECQRYQEVWEVVVVTSTITSTRNVQLSTTVDGPGTLIVETMQIYVTDTIETVDLSTTMYLQTQIETESISRGSKVISTPALGAALPTTTIEAVTTTDLQGVVSTLFVTRHLKYKSSAVVPTSVIRVTAYATQVAGTITRTKPRLQPTKLPIPPL